MGERGRGRSERELREFGKNYFQGGMRKRKDPKEYI
jgi:hypothetical protein